MENEKMPTTSSGIADAITAELSAAPALEAPAPESEVQPAAAVAAEPEAKGQETAPVPSEPPKAFKAKVNGEEIEVPVFEGATINPRLVEAYQKAEAWTRKMQALADEKRKFEAEMGEARARLAAEEAKLKTSALPPLPEDDPYAQRLQAQQAQMDAMQQMLEQARAGVEAQFQAQQEAAALAQLEAEEAKMRQSYGFDEREITLVEQDYMRRAQLGETVSLDEVAKEFRSYLDAKAEAKVKEYKDKHRVGAPAAAASAPAAPPVEKLPAPGQRGFRERILAELGAQ